MILDCQVLQVFCVLVALVHVHLPLTTSAPSSHMLSRSAVQGTTQDLTETGKHFEGDILLIPTDSLNHLLMRRMADDYSHTWPNKTVYYVFTQTLDENYKATFAAAMDEWSACTCIQFALATNGEQDHIVFVKSDELGCSSYVGKKGGPQLVSMSEYCLSTGHAIHVIGHAIGLWHEHSRPDRDTYIDILYDNIRETETDNFGKLPQDRFELVPDVGYDVESIMHYGPFAFSGSNGETIRQREDAPLDYKHCTNLLSMGQRSQLSYLDKLRANRLYSCQAEITSLEAEGRHCVTPATTPILSPTTPITTPPEPTTTVPTIPTPSPPKRLKSGSVITLRLDDPSKSFRDLNSLKCTPTCRTTRCIIWGTKSTCDDIDHRFEIVMPEDPDAKKIKSGAKVALRSKSIPTKWLDCSKTDGTCSISRCGSTSNNADSTNASVTTCNSHYFKIFGVGRRNGRLLNSNHGIRLRHEYNDSYLNCDTGDTCKMSDCADNCEAPSFKFNIIE